MKSFRLKYLVILMQLCCINMISLLIISANCQTPFQVTTLDNPYPGYLKLDGSTSQDFTPIDNYGHRVNGIPAKQGDMYFYQFKNGNIAQFAGNYYNIYNSDMQWIDSIPNPSQYYLDFHDIAYLSNGRYMVLVTESRMVDMSVLVEGGDPHAIVINNIIVETDRTGTIYWQWSSLDHLNITDATPDINVKGQNIDYAHINSIHEDSNGNILISIRHFDEIALINKTTKNFIWRMGGSKCVNNQFTFTNDVMSDFTGFSHQHTAQFLDNGNILLFDNGNLKTPPESRVVEYSVDYANKVVTKVWDYQNEPPSYNFSMGSASRLPNGNTLICWSKDKLIEVRPDKSIALELKLDSYLFIYRAYKVSPRLKFAANTIGSNGEYLFNGINGNTDTKVSVTSISSPTIAYMQKHNYAPPIAKFSDSSFSRVIPFRWVFTPDKGGANIAGSIKIKVSELESGLNPTKLVICKRNKEGEGNFEQLQTSYSSETNELSASFSGWGEFVIVSAILDIPKLATPINGSYLPDEGVLTWNNVNGATRYRVNLSVDSNFTSNVISTIVTGSLKYNFSNLEFNKKYYWRVRALNNLDSSSWSAVGYFNTNIAAPILTKPSDNSFGFKRGDTIRWNSVVGAEKYQLQIGTSDNFVIPQFNIKDLSNNFFSTSNLDYNTKLYWRVRAYSGIDSSKWSAVRSFTTAITNPELATPLDSAINIDNNQMFQWSLVPGAENYLLQVADNINFIKPIIDNNNLKVTQIELSNFDYAHTYYWRVKAIRTTDSSTWSPVWNFSTQLPPVKLQIPKNNEKNVRVDSRLSWLNQEVETKFYLQVALDDNFTDILIDTSDLKTNTFQIIELKANTDFYWRVKAAHGDFVSSWSEVFHFKTGVGLELLPPKLMLPENLSESFSNVDFVWIKRAKAIIYRFQLSQDKEFSSIILDVKTDRTSFVVPDLTVDSKYYWRVKSFSVYDSSAWSEVWSVNVIRGTKHIELTSPRNDDLQVPRSGLLKWEELSEIDYFTVQLAQNEDFSSQIFIEDVVTNSIPYSNLQFNNKYFWRVRFVIGNEVSEWSNVWSFTTITTVVLDTPKVTSHLEGMKAVPVSGSINWQQVQNATDYQVSLSNKSNFSTMFYKQSGIKGLSVAYSDLDFGTDYFIRVSASNDSSKSSWSQPIGFLTELESPIIEHPLDGDEDIPNSGIITWSSFHDFYLYHIQVATDPSFEDIIAESDNFDFVFFNYDLKENTQYFCRVKSYNDTNYSKWSKVVKFKTQNTTSVRNEDMSKSDFIIFPNPANDWINYHQSTDNSINKITITDLQGNEVIKLYNQAHNGKIDVSGLTAGVYFFKTNSYFRLFIKK